VARAVGTVPLLLREGPRSVVTLLLMGLFVAVPFLGPHTALPLARGRMPFRTAATYPVTGRRLRNRDAAAHCWPLAIPPWAYPMLPAAKRVA
jgi:hypothetical protein